MRMMLNSIALKNPLTSKPFIMLDANIIIRPFITKVKSPRLKIFIGKVSIISTGLMIALSAPSRTANQRAVQ